VSAPPLDTSAPAPAVVTETPPPPTAPPGVRHLDLSVGLGGDFWASGVQGSVQPSFAVVLGVGYAFGRSPDAAVRFRLGAVLGSTFLTEPSSTDSFTSLLIDPSLRVRLGAAARFHLDVDLGIGVMLAGGLQPSSTLLIRNPPLMLHGAAQELFELRPALALEYMVRPAFGVFAGPAIAYSPKKEHFFGAIERVELLAGLVVRL
jgi:hypothetical protein